MNEGSLPELLREYYGRKLLPAKELNALVDGFQGSSHRTSRIRPLWKKPKRGIAFALGLVIVALASWPLVKDRIPGVRSGVDTRAAAHSLVEEIAMNHNKRLGIEIPSGSYSELGKSMEKLDFWLAAPTRLKGKGYAVMGGRYCSLQGHLAAQIKLRGSGERIHTLLVSAAAGDLTNLPETDETYNGVRVRIWKEAGLVYGMASNLNDIETTVP